MLISLFFIYGIVIGSFLNVCILRLPKGESIALERSHCNSCGYQLKWFDLIPIISYLFLRGHCRQCHKNISIQYPLIELLNGAAYGFFYLYLGLTVHTIIVCLVFSALVVVFMIDLRHKIIPNATVVIIFILGLIQMFIDQAYVGHIIGFFAASLFLLFLSILMKKGMGFGDIKLMAAAGLLLGWQLIILALMMASVIGSIIGISLIVFKKNTWGQKIPFGPYLATGIMISLLYGNQIISWYLQTTIGV